jgi:beta-lactamase class A
MSSTAEAIATTESRSGLSVTAPIGVQLRVSRDQRAGVGDTLAILPDTDHWRSFHAETSN